MPHTRNIPINTLTARSGENILILIDGDSASEGNGRHALVSLLQKGYKLDTKWKVYSADPSVTVVNGDLVVPAGIQPPLLLAEYDSAQQ